MNLKYILLHTVYIDTYMLRKERFCWKM